LALIAALSDFAPRLGDLVLGWGGIGVFLLTVHFGYAHVLPGVLQIGGWPVRKLFERPFSSRSLTDFWSRRWNLAFVEMSRLLFLKPLRRWFGAAGAVCGVFLISGLLHEFALSYPAAGGWGGPLAYFLLQGGLVLTERRWLHPEWWPAWAGRLWAAAWLLAPLPWLFHAPFRDELIVPLFRYLQKWEVS
jgi:alginate O-acetyltransferase complex protein AlgI